MDILKHMAGIQSFSIVLVPLAGIITAVHLASMMMLQVTSTLKAESVTKFAVIVLFMR